MEVMVGAGRMGRGVGRTLRGLMEQRGLRGEEGGNSEVAAKVLRLLRGVLTGLLKGEASACSPHFTTHNGDKKKLCVVVHGVAYAGSLVLEEGTGSIVEELIGALGEQASDSQHSCVH
jgi:hypothetical protein